ncbi:hypothetical protein lerEdw1_003902 [Lerista edwardsae]|nr:hypothetical protein lerEdw1_003902 [Lerista edwardsae]
MVTADPLLTLSLANLHDYFTALDYIIFAVMLLISASIGIYYAFKGVHKTYEEFVLGSRRLHCVPVALSLTASFMSAVTVLGTPAEIYRYGMQYIVFAISHLVLVTVTAHVVVPVYYRLRITSAYEYLELRFNKCLRLTGTIMFIMQTIFFSGVVIYAPSLALSQVTGFELWGAVIGTGTICIFYCTLGGLKAVVWTDVFQFLLMIIAFILVICRTVAVRGGLSRILDDARRGGRLDVWDFNPSPFQRHTFWTIVIGGSFSWLGIYVLNQSQVQRCLACKSEIHAKVALYINLLGLWLTLICAVLSGLSMYSMFKDCDPWTAKKVEAPDQLMPYLVLELWKDFPGVLGLFVAGTYSGTLRSIVWRNMHCHGGSVLHDVWHFIFLHRLHCYFALLQIAISIFGMISGPFLGIFALGVLLSSANAKGALSGLIGGLIITIWLGVGSLMYPPPPHRTMPLHLSTAGCHEFNWTVPTTVAKPPTAPRPPISENWYGLSYLYLSVVGTIVTVIVGTVVSLSTGGLKQDTDRSLLFLKEDLIADYEYLKAKAVLMYETFHPAQEEVPE